MTAAAFTADFSTFKNVPSRKCVQLVFEIPTEAFADALEKLGGAPNPGASVSVAIARLVTTPAPEKPKRERLTSERAAMLCRDEDRPGGFRNWLFSRHPGADREIPTDDMLRFVLKIDSRRELDSDPEARKRFEILENEFNSQTGRMAHVR